MLAQVCVVQFWYILVQWRFRVTMFWERQDCQIECWTKLKTSAATSTIRGAGQLKKVQQINSTFHAFAAILENGSVVCGFQCTERIGWYVFLFGISGNILTPKEWFVHLTDPKIMAPEPRIYACQTWRLKQHAPLRFPSTQSALLTTLSLFHITCFVKGTPAAGLSSYNVHLQLSYHFWISEIRSLRMFQVATVNKNHQVGATRIRVVTAAVFQISWWTSSTFAPQGEPSLQLWRMARWSPGAIRTMEVARSNRTKWRIFLGF